MTHGDSRPALAATIMTEDAKTEGNTAGGPCGAYIVFKPACLKCTLDKQT